MRDRRRVDELSIEELEQVLALRRREERMKRLEKLQKQGRVVESGAPAVAKPAQTIAPGMNLLEEDSPPPKPSQPRTPKASRRVANAFLTLVEVAAVFGLVFLGWQLYSGIGVLESRSAEAQQAAEAAVARSIPTIAPTPVVSLNQIVLPGGHKWEEGITPTLNLDEIPEHLRFAVADQVLRPVLQRPPATAETALRLTIPRLNIDQSIVQGSDWEALKQGVGQILNGHDPTDVDGNVALTAHNDIYGELFRHLDQLQVGDQFQIQTRTQVYLYQVTETQVVEPTDVHVLNSVGRPTATLISCYPYRVDTQRIVVFADRID
ncbi:MAG: sortase [Phototrophicaceae bacterium]